MGLYLKRVFRFTFLLLAFGIILVACSEKEEQLSRVDVKKVNEKGNYEDVILITDKEQIVLISNILERVSWEPNADVELSRKEDVLANLLYTFEKNKPEKLYEYKFWFNKNETTTIINTNEKERYGTLDKENSQSLKNTLFK